MDDKSLNIERCEIFANGAGKSTIINILNTLVKPDLGDVIIDGINIKNDGETIKLIMGVVPQEIALPFLLHVKVATFVRSGYRKPRFVGAFRF